MSMSQESLNDALTEAATSRFAEVDGATVHYHEAGEGEPLIMLHGAGPGASAWSNFKQNLPVLSKNRRVLMIDQPGFGKSSKSIPDDETRSAYGIRLIVGLMEQLGIEQADFVGNSWGGRVSMGMALKHPEKVRRMVLMGPGGGLSLFHSEPSEGMKQLRNFFAPPGPNKERMEQLIRTFLYDQSMVTDELVEERLASATDPETEAFFKKHLSAPDSREPQLWRELENIPHRTLLVWGRDDRTTPFDGGLIMLKRMPDARLHIIPKCGHWVQAEKREEFNDLVRNFFGAD